MSAILRTQNLEFICWKLYVETFSKLPDGNLLLDTSSFSSEKLWHKAMVSLLQFQGNETWSTVNEKKSGSTDLSRMMRSEVRLSRGMGFLSLMVKTWSSGSIWWASASKQRVRL